MRAACVACAIFAQASALQAQMRVRAAVEYVTASNVYLSAGQLQGLFAGDTVSVHRDTLGIAVTQFVIVSATRARSVAISADTTFHPLRGDVLFVTISATAAQRMAKGRDSAATAAVGTPPPPPLTRSRTPTGRHRSVNGRVGLELNATRTWSRYGPGEEQVDVHTYLNPTFRLRLRTDHLPGGMRFVTDLRATYLNGVAARPDEFIVQLYQASLEADIPRTAVHMQLGRFYNSYESHSGFWDGMLVRVGSARVGGGVVLGYAPTLANQNISSVAPKYSAFVDGHVRNGSWRYDVDVSAHHQSNVFFTGEQREFVGFSQSIGYGRAFFTQRVQFGRTSGEFSLWQGQATGNIPIAGPLSVHMRYSTERNTVFFHDPDMLGHRTRWSAGAVLAGRAGYANVEAGSIASGLGTRANSISAGFFMPRLLAVAGLGFNGSTSRDDRFTTSYLAPFVERTSGLFRARLAGSYYRTDYGASVFEQKGGELSLVLPLGGRTEVGWSAAATAGMSVRTARTALSLWRSF